MAGLGLGGLAAFLTTDGRGLDTKVAVLEFLAEVEAEREADRQPRRGGEKP